MGAMKPENMTRVVVRLPPSLLGDLEPILAARELTIDKVIRLYLRSLVTTSKRTGAIGLADEMPIGKFKGEPLETVIRAEPKYVEWLLGKVETFRVTPDALDLIDELTGFSDEVTA